MSDYDDLIEALDDYRARKDEWWRDLSQPGFYDPTDSRRDYAEKEIAKAHDHLDKVFRALVLKVIEKA